MFFRIISFIALIILAFPAVSFSFQGYLQPLGDNGTIAWGNGEIAVVRPLDAGGDVKLTPLSVRKATSSARKQMLDIIYGVRIDSKRTISAFLSEDDELAARVRGVVQNSPLERPAMFEEGGEVRVTEQFRGKLAELVLPTTVQFQSGIPPKLSTSMEQSFSFTDGVPEATDGTMNRYTGVIIDARGMQITPALTPVVYGQDGVGAYGAFLVSRASAIDRGVVAYATTTDPTVLRKRVGGKPLTVRAVSAFGSWRTDLIVSTSMAKLIRAVMHSKDAVDNCRVVIVVDAHASPGSEEGVVTEETGPEVPAEE